MEQHSVAVDVEKTPQPIKRSWFQPTVAAVANLCTAGSSVGAVAPRKWK